MENNPSISNTSVEPSDYDCFVCFDIMCEPSKTPCGHYMCLGCLENVLILKRNCPFCRTEVPNGFEPTLDKEKQKEVRAKQTARFKEKMKEIALMRQQCDNLTLVYGNTHQIVNMVGSSNHHSWTAFVKLADAKLVQSKFIKKVVFKLHPTFRNPEREVRAPSYEIGCVGWGVFLIPITVHWQDWLEKEPTKFNHYLSFYGNGESNSTKIKFDKPLFKPIEQGWEDGIEDEI